MLPAIPGQKNGNEGGTPSMQDGKGPLADFRGCRRNPSPSPLHTLFLKQSLPLTRPSPCQGGKRRWSPASLSSLCRRQARTIRYPGLEKKDYKSINKFDQSAPSTQQPGSSRERLGNAWIGPHRLQLPKVGVNDRRELRGLIRFCLSLQAT